MRINPGIGLILLLFTPMLFANDSFENKLSTIATEFMDKSGYMGLSVAAQHGDKALFNLSFGHTDIGKHHPFTERTVVALGSNMKVVTAYLIHQLSDQNKIAIDAPINRYLKNKIKHGDKVTVRQLLCHTSGLPNIFGEGEFKDYQWKKAASQKELQNQLHSSLIVPKPNQDYHYNNTGYLILGWLIEDVSRMSLGDYTREHFIKSMHLKNTYYLGDSFYIPEFSQGFKSSNGAIELIPQNELIEYRVAGGSGAIGGTLSDYNQWFSQVAKGTHISNKTKKLMQTPCVLNNGKNAPEGMGIEWSIIEGEKALNGGGVVNGFLSLAYYFPDYDLTIGFVGNTETDWGEFHQQYYSTVLKWFKDQH